MLLGSGGCSVGRFPKRAGEAQVGFSGAGGAWGLKFGSFEVVKGL